MSISKEEYMKITADELHKPFRKKFPRRTLTFESKDQTWALDLVDMSEWSKENDGFKFMLNVVDGFTRHAWSRPLSDKSAVATFAAFDDIITRHGRKPKSLWVDQGKEFWNKWFQRWCKDNQANMYSTFGDHKAVLVERYNRTSKTEMWKRFTAGNTRRWIDMLPDLLKWYNNRPHTSLGRLTPVQASEDKNKERVALLVSAKKSSGKDPRKAEYSLGDKVRISRLKGIFEKGYLPNWSQEIFKVSEIRRYDDYDTPILYKVTDWRGEELEGTFYSQELQKVSEKIDDVRLIEKVVKTRMRNKKKEILVKWLGLPESHNQWIPAENVVHDFSS